MKNRNLLVIVLGFIIAYYVLLTLNFWLIWYKYASTELFNYLIITPLVLLIIFMYLTGNRYGFGKNSLNQVIFLMILAISIFLYVYAPYSQFIDQFLIAGTVFSGVSILVLFINTPSHKKLLLSTLILILTSLLIIPLPVGIVFDLSAYLTRYVLEYSIPLARFMGANLRLGERGGLVIVSVLSPNGWVHYHIAPICSGIIGMLSVLAVSPLILLVALNGYRRLVYRIIGGIIGVVILALLMFAANIFRLALVFYTTSILGKDIGYGIFHYTSELILVLPIVFLDIKITSLIIGGYKLEFNKPVLENIDVKTITVPLITVLIGLSLLLPITYSYNYTTPSHYFVNLDEGPPKIFDVDNGSVNDYVPRRLMNMEFKYYGRIKEWEKSLDPSTRIHFYRYLEPNSSKTIDIYIEFSDRGSGIHVWEICLPWQNITVYNTSWPLFMSPDKKAIRQVWFITYGRGDFKGALYYWRDKVYTGTGVKYFRLTVMLNSYGRENISSRDLIVIRKLAYELWIRSLPASYSMHGILSIGYQYLGASLIVIMILVLIIIMNPKEALRNINILLKKSIKVG